MLTKSLKTLQVTKSKFYNSITFTVTCDYGQDAGVDTESVFRLSDFLDIYLTTFFMIHNLENS